MPGTKAWQRHGCYALGSDQYFNMPMGKAMLGCQDQWNALDHFDPSTDTRRVFSQFNYLRTVYGALQDGFNLVQPTSFSDRVLMIPRPRWGCGRSLVQRSLVPRLSRATIPTKSGCCISTRTQRRPSNMTARAPSGFHHHISLVQPFAICSHPMRPISWSIPCLPTSITARPRGSDVSVPL